MLLGKVPLFMGYMHFQDIGEGFVRCSDLEQLPRAVEQALVTPAARRESLELYLASIFKNSFALHSMLLNETGGSEVDNRAALADGLADYLLSSLKREDREMTAGNGMDG